MLLTIRGGKLGRILLYIIPGRTPFLLGRPATERLGLSLDFGEKLLKWPGREWEPVQQNRHGHYVVSLLEVSGACGNYEMEEEYTYVPEDLGDHVDKEQWLSVDQVLYASECSESAVDDYSPNSKCLAGPVMHKLQTAVRQAGKVFDALLAEARAEPDRRRKCW